jgi:hypothetical protein
MFGRKEKRIAKYVQANGGSIVHHIFRSVEDALDGELKWAIDRVYDEIANSERPNPFSNKTEFRNRLYVALVCLRANLELAEVNKNLGKQASDHLRECLDLHLQGFDIIPYQKWIDYMNCALRAISLTGGDKKGIDFLLPAILTLTFFHIFERDHPEKIGILKALEDEISSHHFVSALRHNGSLCELISKNA